MKIKSAFALIVCLTISMLWGFQTVMTASPSIFQTVAKIAFVSDRDGNYEIYTMGTDGSNVQRLTFNEGNDWYPDWSPDGMKIAFTSNRENIASDIYIMDADGSNLFNVTNNGEYNDRHPAWSPSGTRIAFSRMIGGSSDIYVVNRDGSGLQKIVDGEGITYNLKPTWSPDGSQIMFTTANDLPRVGLESASIRTVNADGTNLTRVSIGEINTDGDLDWSWANNTIAYYEAAIAGLVIYTVDVDMSNATSITSIPEGQLRSDKSPSWSPHGNQIVYQSKITSQSDANTDIYVLNTATGISLNITPGSLAEDIMPDWQPISTIASFTLVNTDTNQDIRTLSNSDTIDLVTDNRTLNVRANSSPVTVGSVVFELTNPDSSVTTRTDDSAPYTLIDESTDWTPVVGSYSLTATPYDQSGGTGTAGTPLTINFTVVDPNTAPTTSGISNITVTEGTASSTIHKTGS